MFNTAGASGAIDYNNYASDGSTVTSVETNTFRVNGGASFKGTTGLYELVFDDRITFTNAAVNGPLAGLMVGPTNLKFYMGSAGGKWSYHGLVSSSGGSVTTTTLTPAREVPTAPVLNTVSTSSYALAADSGGGAVTTELQTVRNTYQGVVQVTVAAGTFSACKILEDTTINGTTTQTTAYLVATGRFKGMRVREEFASGLLKREARLITLN